MKQNKDKKNIVKKNVKLISKSSYKSVLEVKQNLLRKSRKRALEKGLPFNITLQDIHIPKKCPILKVPLICSTRYAPSIDKIYPEKGYVKGNIAIISTLANSMKANATPFELKVFSKNIKKYMETYLFQEIEVDELPIPLDYSEMNEEN